MALRLSTIVCCMITVVLAPLGAAADSSQMCSTASRFWELPLHLLAVPWALVLVLGVAALWAWRRSCMWQRAFQRELISSCTGEAAAQSFKAALHDDRLEVDKYDNKLLQLLELAAHGQPSTWHQQQHLQSVVMSKLFTLKALRQKCRSLAEASGAPMDAQATLAAAGGSSTPTSPAPYCAILSRSKLQPSGLSGIRKLRIPGTPGTPGTALQPTPNASPALSLAARSDTAASPLLRDQLISPAAVASPAPAAAGAAGAVAGDEPLTAAELAFSTDLWAAVLCFQDQLDSDTRHLIKIVTRLGTHAAMQQKAAVVA